MSALPTGTVTFLFTDIAGSTRLLQQLGPQYTRALGEHQALLRDACAAHGGVEVDTQGDAFFVAFASAPQAVAAASQATRALAAHAWPHGTNLQVRMGLHTGTPQLVGDHYIGLDVHRAARITAAGHGGQILLSAATAELARHDLPDGVTLRDLGAHRLKDLLQAERVYQAVLADLPADFPPLKALDARPNNLPVQPSALLGREREVAAVVALLRREDVRLVTLTGPGGIGKTRLSLQVAADLLGDFQGGVWSVRLSRLTDPELVLPTIAQTLHLTERGGTPLPEVLLSHLRDKHQLLVLDNFEQVAQAAPRIGELLAACPGVQVLVTSRVPLHLRGEHEVALRPLALPDPARLPTAEQLSQYAGVALFIERAQAAQADFRLTSATAPAIAEICARLDGLPLAIELAAARVKLLPPVALLQRLEPALPMLTGGPRDLDERQQTMRNTLAWSYDLLAPEEQCLFRRLAVFVGGCMLEAAEAVCAAAEGAAPLDIDVLEGLSRLVDQSLVHQREHRGEPHFGMLQVLREFAAEQLAARGEAEALRQAHAVHFLALAERAEPELTGPRAAEWYARLELDHDNLRAALSWMCAGGEADSGLRMGNALGRFWYERGYLTEGRTWLESLLALVTPDRDADNELLVWRAKVHNWTGWLALMQGDVGSATAHLERCLALARQARDVRTEGAVLNDMGTLAYIQGDLDAAAARHADSLELARRLGDPRACAVAQDNLSFIAFVRGDLLAAQTLLDEAMAGARQVGDRVLLSQHWSWAGSIARKRGDFARAWALQRDALAMQWELGVRMLAAETLQHLAATAGASGQGERAARLYGAGAAVFEDHSLLVRPAWRADAHEAVAAAHSALTDEAWQSAYEAGRALSLDEAIAEVLAST